MPAFSAVVMFAVIWVMAFLALLPVGLKTQGEDGKVEPGTHEGAPVNFRFAPLAWRVTAVASVLWAALFAAVTWGGFTIDSLDFLDAIAPLPE